MNKKKLIINYGKISIIMTANSNKVTVDKSNKWLNTYPTIYKDKYYIPVKSTVQLLGLKYACDNIEKSVYIQNENEYNKVKSILDKAINTTKAIDKYIVEHSFSYIANYKENPFFVKSSSVSKIDKNKMIMTQKGDSEDSIFGSDKDEYYLFNNYLYSKYSFNEKWNKELLSAKDYEEQIFQYDVSKLDVSEILYCGLIIEESIKDKTIKLKGNVYPFVNISDSEVEPVDTYIEISINKTNNLINKIIHTYNENVDSSDIGKYLCNINQSYVYKEFNGNFVIETPDEDKMEFEN